MPLGGVGAGTPVAFSATLVAKPHRQRGFKPGDTGASKAAWAPRLPALETPARPRPCRSPAPGPALKTPLALEPAGRDPTGPAPLWGDRCGPEASSGPAKGPRPRASAPWREPEGGRPERPRVGPTRPALPAPTGAWRGGTAGAWHDAGAVGGAAALPGGSGPVPVPPRPGRGLARPCAAPPAAAAGSRGGESDRAEPSLAVPRSFAAAAAGTVPSSPFRVGFWRCGAAGPGAGGTAARLGSGPRAGAGRWAASRPRTHRPFSRPAMAAPGAAEGPLAARRTELRGAGPRGEGTGPACSSGAARRPSPSRVYLIWFDSRCSPQRRHPSAVPGAPRCRRRPSPREGGLLRFPRCAPSPAPLAALPWPSRLTAWARGGGGREGRGGGGAGGKDPSVGAGSRLLRPARVRRGGRGASLLASGCITRPTHAWLRAARRGRGGCPELPCFLAGRGLFAGLQASMQGFSLLKKPTKQKTSKPKKSVYFSPNFDLLSIVTSWSCFSVRLTPCFIHLSGF